jgi:hypothetical protein
MEEPPGQYNNRNDAIEKTNAIRTGGFSYIMTFLLRDTDGTKLSDTVSVILLLRSERQHFAPHRLRVQTSNQWNTLHTSLSLDPWAFGIRSGDQALVH